MAFLLDEASVLKLKRMVAWWDQQQATPTRRRRVRQGPFGGGDVGFNRARGTCTAAFDGDTTDVTVNNIVASHGDQPTEQAADSIECWNLWKLASTDNALVGIEWHKDLERWVIYQVQHTPTEIITDVFLSSLDIKQDKRPKASVATNGEFVDELIVSGTSCP